MRQRLLVNIMHREDGLYEVDYYDTWSGIREKVVRSELFQAFQPTICQHAPALAGMLVNGMAHNPSFEKFILEEDEVSIMSIADNVYVVWNPLAYKSTYHYLVKRGVTLSDNFPVFGGCKAEADLLMRMEKDSEPVLFNLSEPYRQGWPVLKDEWSSLLAPAEEKPAPIQGKTAPFKA